MSQSRSSRRGGTGRASPVLITACLAVLFGASASCDRANAASAPVPQADGRAATLPQTDAGKAIGAPDVIFPDDLQSILDIASGYGEATLETTESGDPVIVGSINGVSYQLFFLDCTGHRSCEIQNFYAIWDTPGVTLDAVNAWNREKPFHKAYLTEDAFPVIELNLSIAGGISRTQMLDAFDRWTIALAEFQSEMLDPGL